MVLFIFLVTHVHFLHNRIYLMIQKEIKFHFIIFIERNIFFYNESKNFVV